MLYAGRSLPSTLTATFTLIYSTATKLFTNSSRTGVSRTGSSGGLERRQNIGSSWVTQNLRGSRVEGSLLESKVVGSNPTQSIVFLFASKGIESWAGRHSIVSTSWCTPIQGLAWSTSGPNGSDNPSHPPAQPRQFTTTDEPTQSHLPSKLPYTFCTS